MKSITYNCRLLAGLIGFSLVSAFLASTPTASAQSSGASATNAAGNQKTLSPSLPPGVFQGSLPQTNTDSASREAGNKAYDAILHGEDLLKSGHVSGAVAEFQHALDYVPTDGLAYQRLAEAYITLGKSSLASQAFHKALIEDAGSGIGGNADVWAEYALMLAKTNQPVEAIQMYNHAAYLLDYEDSQYHNGQPTLKVLFPEVVMGDSLPGQVAYTPERLQALADALLAHTQQGFWSYKEIKAHAEEAVKLYPDSAPVQYYLGEALYGSYYAVLDSSVKDKAAARAAFQEDKKGEVEAYQKAAELGDDATVAAAKEQLKRLR